MRDSRTDGGRRGQGGGSTSRGRGGNLREPAQSNTPRRNMQASYDRTQGGYDRQPARRRFVFRPASVGAILLAALVITAIIIGISINAEKQNLNSDTITAGVKINGADYSGWEVERLSKQLKDDFKKRFDNISIKITWQDKVWTLGGADLGATHNIDEIVSKASLLARVGSQQQRSEEAKKIKAQGQEYTVQVNLDSAALKIKLEEIASEIGTQGHNATVVFNPGLVDFNIPKNIEDLKPTQEELDKMFSVTPETPGKTVDVDMMVQKVLDGLKDSSKLELELLVNDFVPQVTEAKLRESFHLLNAYRTQLSGTSTQARNDNIALALSKFNGLTLLPGQVLSFNETTGERSEANGYQPAPTIGSSKAIVDDYGGGVCQASTTLYNTALMSGCEVLDRGHHSFPSAYAMKGFDAMVNWPSADLKIKNVSDSNMYIKAYVKKPYVYVMIFGKPLKDGTKITRESELLFQGPDPEVITNVDKKGEYAEFVKYQEDEPYVLVKGQPQMTYKAYLVYWDKNGNMIEKKELYEDTFKEIKRVEIIGKDPRPVDSPKPEDTGGHE